MKEMINKQFTLTPEGEIYWQAQANNPMKGELVAKLEKGDDPLAPKISLRDNAAFKDQDQDLITKHVNSWLEEYIATTLEVLIALKDEESLNGAAKDIAQAVYNAMGVIPRAELETHIEKLDADLRQELRHKKVKLGPVLVFQPPLNKPAAINLRAVLWHLWNDKALPANVPADGIVSFKIENPDEIDPRYYQAIGYPVYGPKAIRIDMLDRVIIDIYDSSKDWEFVAKHQYAEWLGSNIEDLYVILEAMGHKKAQDTNVDKSEEEDPVLGEDGKPLLATFKLRKGKMSGKAKSGNIGAKESKFKGKDKPKKKVQKRPHKKPQSKEPRVVSAAAKGQQDDNPFAVLEQLKNAK